MEWDIRDDMNGLVCFCRFYPEPVATICCGSNFTACYSNYMCPKMELGQHFLPRKQQTCQIEPLRTIAGGYGI